MTVRPILFSAPMVRALIEGRKTQTRRIFTSQPGNGFAVSHYYSEPTGVFQVAFKCADRTFSFPTKFAPGDLLWARETWSHTGEGVWTIASAQIASSGGPIYAADGTHDAGCKFWPSIHMPRRFSRLTLEVTGVRVQRLQDISEEDARAEGIQRGEFGWLCYQPEPKSQDEWLCPRESFRTLWDSLNAKRGFGWDANPWVVAISFTVHKQNVDALLQARAA